MKELVDTLTAVIASDAMRDRVISTVTAARERDLRATIFVAPARRRRNPGPKTRIRGALVRVQEEIQGLSRGVVSDSMYARGLSREGYSGGYERALQDVLLVLDGVLPNTRSYWREF